MQYWSIVLCFSFIWFETNLKNLKSRNDDRLIWHGMDEMSAEIDYAPIRRSRIQQPFCARIGTPYVHSRQIWPEWCVGECQPLDDENFAIPAGRCFPESRSITVRPTSIRILLLSIFDRLARMNGKINILILLCIISLGIARGEGLVFLSVP